MTKSTITFEVTYANINFSNGQISSLSIGYTWNEGSEYLSGSLDVPFSEISDMSYENLTKIVASNLKERIE